LVIDSFQQPVYNNYHVSPGCTVESVTAGLWPLTEVSRRFPPGKGWLRF
jgi:hypothetical protein